MDLFDSWKETTQAPSTSGIQVIIRILYHITIGTMVLRPNFEAYGKYIIAIPDPGS